MSKYKSLGAAKNDGISSFGAYCEGCLEKQRLIDEMREYITSLQARLNYRDRKDTQPFFGSSTPSSNLPFKENTLEENRLKKGGSKPGHKGNGRKRIVKSDADRIVRKPVEEKSCPSCGGDLEHKDTLFRGVIDCFLNKAEKLLYECEVKRCVKCNKTFSNKPPVKRFPINRLSCRGINTATI